jgi:cytoskeletal protein RodZ
MTTRDQIRRRGADLRLDPSRSGVSAEPAPTLPERLYAARERKGVDLYRAERDTKIRAKYLAALERGDWKELPGAVYTKGFLRNYALYLGFDPEEILGQWRRERGDNVAQQPSIVVPRPITAPRPALTFTPGVIVAAVLTVAVIAFGVYLGIQLLRFAKPPTIAVTDPARAVIEVADDTTEYTLRGNSIPGASIEIATSDPGKTYRVTAGSTGAWSATVDLVRGKNQFDVTAIDLETGKRAEQSAKVVITVPVLVIQAPTLTIDQPAEGATYENGAIPVGGRTTNATKVELSAMFLGPVGPGTAGPPSPPPSPSPGASPAPSPTPAIVHEVTPAEDGTFTTPVELTAGHWSLTVTASSADGKTVSLTRNVTVAYEGVNLVIKIKGSRAWLKVWVDGKVSDVTGSAGRTYSPGKTLTFTAEKSIVVRTGKSSATYFTLNGQSLGRMSDRGNPETWLFEPPNPPTKTQNP